MVDNIDYKYRITARIKLYLKQTFQEIYRNLTKVKQTP